MPRSAHALLQRALHRRPHRDLAREFVGDLARGGALLREHVHDQPAQLLNQVCAERLRLVHVTPVRLFVRFCGLLSGRTD
jgi:hypothetical protein